MGEDQHLDEVFASINGETYYLWRVVDHEGEVFEVFAYISRIGLDSNDSRYPP